VAIKQRDCETLAVDHQKKYILVTVEPAANSVPNHAPLCGSSVNKLKLLKMLFNLP
jgi:hypothetical protein